MITKKLIEAEIENLFGLTGMIEAYEEIAAIRIKRTRDSVLKSRSYTSEINTIFQQVKSSYKNELEKLSKKGSFIEKNGKTLSVFISANTGLYGDIVQKTFDLFLKEIKGQKTEVVIIGKLGLFLFEKANIGIPYTYFDLPDQNIDSQKLREIAIFLLKYEKIKVFYSQFQSIIKQEPVVSDISGNLLAQEEKEGEIVIKYLFEPSLEKILGFFESEIFTSIFEQTVRESSLAKFASRLIALTEATENINKRLKNVTIEKERIRHSDVNKKQLQTLLSMRLWRQV